MTRTHPSAQMQALQRIQLQSMRQKLKLDSARARQAVADAPREESMGPNGRPIVRYADMPEMDANDMQLLEQEFLALACPHAAVLSYRPGYEDRGCTDGHAQDCWWFFETGMEILKALSVAIISHKAPDIIAQISTPDFDAEAALTGMTKYLLLKQETQTQAAMASDVSPEEFEAKTKAELAEIRQSIESRFEAMAAP